MSGNERKRQKRTETAEQRKAREDRERKAEEKNSRRRANDAAAKAAREAEQARLTALLRAGGLRNLAVNIIVGLRDLIPPTDLDIGALLGLADDAAAQQPLDPAAVLTKIAATLDPLMMTSISKVFKKMGEKLTKWMRRLRLDTFMAVPFLVPNRTASSSLGDGDGVPRERQPGSKSESLQRDVRGQVQTVLLRAFLSRDGIWPGEAATRTSAVWLADVDASTGVAAGWQSAEAAAAKEAAKQKKKERAQARYCRPLAFDAASEAAREAAKKLTGQRTAWEEERLAEEEEKRRLWLATQRAYSQEREEQARAAGVKGDVYSRGAYSSEKKKLDELWNKPASALQNLGAHLKRSRQPKLKEATGVKPESMSKRDFMRSQNVPQEYGGPETPAPQSGMMEMTLFLSSIRFSNGELVTRDMARYAASHSETVNRIRLTLLESSLKLKQACVCKRVLNLTGPSMRQWLSDFANGDLIPCCREDAIGEAASAACFEMVLHDMQAHLEALKASEAEVAALNAAERAAFLQSLLEGEMVGGDCKTVDISLLGRGKTHTETALHKILGYFISEVTGCESETRFFLTHFYVDVGCDLSDLSNYVFVGRLGPHRRSTVDALKGKLVTHRKTRVVNGAKFDVAVPSEVAESIPELMDYIPPTAKIVPPSLLDELLQLSSMLFKEPLVAPPRNLTLAETFDASGLCHVNLGRTLYGLSDEGEAAVYSGVASSGTYTAGSTASCESILGQGRDSNVLQRNEFVDANGLVLSGVEKKRRMTDTTGETALTATMREVLQHETVDSGETCSHIVLENTAGSLMTGNGFGGSGRVVAMARDEPNANMRTLFARISISRSVRPQVVTAAMDADRSNYKFGVQFARRLQERAESVQLNCAHPELAKVSKELMERHAQRVLGFTVAMEAAMVGALCEQRGHGAAVQGLMDLDG